MLHQISIFLKIIALRYFIKYVQVDGTGMKWFCSLKKTAGKYFHFVLQAGGSNSWTMISQVAAEPILESISLIRSLGWCHRKDHNVKTKPWNWCFYQMRELKPKGKHQLHLIDKDKKRTKKKFNKLLFLHPTLEHWSLNQCSKRSRKPVTDKDNSDNWIKRYIYWIIFRTIRRTGQKPGKNGKDHLIWPYFYCHYILEFVHFANKTSKHTLLLLPR